MTAASSNLQGQARNGMDEHRWKEGIPFLIDDLRTHPDDPWSLMDLGSCHYELRNTIDAMRLFQRAGELLLDDPLPIGLQGDVLMLTREYDEAGDFYRRALQLAPESDLAQRNF